MRRRATPAVEYYTKRGKKVGRSREDDLIYAVLTTEYQLVREIQDLWPVFPVPSWHTINKRLQRAQARYPKLIEHERGRGWRRTT